MTEGRLRALSAIVALLGAGIAAYLLYARSSGRFLCATGGCETVQASSYAEVLGLPVAGLGLTGFLTLAVAAAAPGELARTFQAVVALAAAAFGAYLLYVQIALIGRICDWCVASDIVASLAAALALLRLGAPVRQRSSPQRPQRTLGWLTRASK